MRAWILKADITNYDSLRGDISAEQAYSFDGRHHASGWEPLQVGRMEPVLGLPMGNITRFSFGTPAVDEKAKTALQGLVENDVEFLPLFLKRDAYYLLNVTTVLNCVDYEESEYKLFKSGERIMRFIKYVFKEDVIGDHCIFKIIDQPVSHVFITDRFAKCIEKSRLTGSKLKLVWDSEEKAN